MTNYLINTMDIGNSIFLIYSEEGSSKMYPFENDLIATIPVGDVTHLEWNLRLLRKFYSGNINVMSSDSVQVEETCTEYNAIFHKINSNFLKQVSDLSLGSKQTIIISNGTLLSEKLCQELIESFDNDEERVFISAYDDMVKSITSKGVQETNGLVENIYGHPRPHYVNGYSVGIFKLSCKSIDSFKYTSQGFESVNCGQMPDEKYYLENAIQKIVSNSVEVKSKYLTRKDDYAQINFTYEIIEANQFAAKELLKGNSKTSKTAKVSDEATINGKLIIGENSVIGKNVTIEGDCWIGDNVTIDNGVVIGSNCVINSGTTIKNYSLVNDNTVIGPNNKIGFIAEVSGVTFKGVSATHNCEVYGVIGKSVDIAAGVQTAILRFDDELVPVRINGKKYANNYTSYIAIGHYTRTGVNNVIAPGVRIGSRSAISPGIVVNRDVSHNSILSLEQNVSTSPWGSERYGW